MESPSIFEMALPCKKSSTRFGSAKLSIFVIFWFGNARRVNVAETLSSPDIRLKPVDIKVNDRKLANPSSASPNSLIGLNIISISSTASGASSPIPAKSSSESINKDSFFYPTGMGGPPPAPSPPKYSGGGMPSLFSDGKFLGMDPSMFTPPYLLLYLGVGIIVTVILYFLAAVIYKAFMWFYFKFILKPWVFAKTNILCPALKLCFCCCMTLSQRHQELNTLQESWQQMPIARHRRSNHHRKQCIILCPAYSNSNQTIPPSHPCTASLPMRCVKNPYLFHLFPNLASLRVHNQTGLVVTLLVNHPHRAHRILR